MEESGDVNSGFIPASEESGSLLDPPALAELTNREVNMFAEAITTLLEFGIFRSTLAQELSAYRDSADEVMRSRISAGKGP